MRSTVLILSLLGCQTEPTQPTTGPATPSPDTPAAVCAPLVVDPADATVRPRDLVQLQVAGGSGTVRFELPVAGSGGSVHPSTGSYLAGPTADRADTILVIDDACDLEARVRVSVTSGLVVVPRRAAIVPGGVLTLDASGGSGEVTCELVTTESGGRMGDHCTLHAGSGRGTDTVRFTDTATGEQIDVWVHVGAEHAMRVRGHGRLFVPFGEVTRVTSVGGSGRLVISSPDGGPTTLGDAILGDVAGDTVVTVRDGHTGETAQVPVTVVEPLVPQAIRDGERSGEGVVRPLGDKDGDGKPDAVLGFVELSIDAHYGGGVVVYAGGEGGLLPTPVQVLAGAGDEETFGRAVAVADVTGDGEVDLIVGADRANVGATNSGRVEIYAGIPGGWFDPVPVKTLVGEGSYERLGASLAACDFDGDGFMDLAAGAMEGTDRNVAIPAENQGAIYVYRGSASGFGDRPDFILYGVVPQGGGFVSRRNLEVGTTLAAGDLDGDGLCDLAAGAPEGQTSGSADDGLILVYAGTTDQGLLLTREPVWVLAGAPGSDDELGHALAIGDLDDDGAAELVAGHWQDDENGSQGGSVRVFRGGPFPSLPTDVTRAAEAAWVVHGTGSFDYVGSDVQVADGDGDGDLDLLVAAYRDELATEYSQGLVHVYTGLDADLATGAPVDATGRVPDRTWAGPTDDSRLGQAAALVDDLSGDGLPDLLAIAGYDNAWGVEAGAAVFGESRTGATTLLDWPGQAAGHDHGLSVAIHDVDRDGSRDIVIGAPGAPDPGVGANAGQVEVRHGRPGATFDPVPVQILGGHPGHDASDRLGWHVATAGDFDGDGRSDLAVLARSQPGDADHPGLSDPDNCATDRSLAGALHVVLSTSSGLDATSSFVWVGPEASGYARVVAGDFDHDGDGYDDLIVASTDWGDGHGGFALIRGRPRPSSPTLICDAEVFTSAEEFDRLGASITGLGDVDGDGCDEVAVGATGEEIGDDWYNQGVVRVLWGHGGPGCPSAAAVSTLSVKVIGTGLGSALAGGEDVDGDRIPDMVVGGSTYRVTFAEHGVVWMVPGSRLRTLPREPLAPGRLPDQPTWSLLLPEQGLTDRHGIVGDVAGGAFGSALALVDDPEDSRRAMVAVGAPMGAEGGALLGGGVTMWRFHPGDGGFDTVPWGLLGGEARSPGMMGTSLDSAILGGIPVIAVGGPRSDVGGLDVGAVWVLAVR